MQSKFHDLSWVLLFAAIQWILYRNEQTRYFQCWFTVYPLYFSMHLVAMCRKPPAVVVPPIIPQQYPCFVPSLQETLKFQQNVLISTCSIVDIHKKPLKNIRFQLSFTYHGKVYSFPVTRQTLMRRYSSYFYELFTKQLDRSQITVTLHHDLKDHPPNAVSYILSFLSEQNDSLYLPKDENERETLLKEARFFGCPQLISLWGSSEQDISAITWEDWLMQQCEAYHYQHKLLKPHPIFSLDPAFVLNLDRLQISFPEILDGKGSVFVWDTLTPALKQVQKMIHKKRIQFYGRLATSALVSEKQEAEGDEKGEVKEEKKDERKVVSSRKHLEPLLQLLHSLGDKWKNDIFLTGHSIESLMILHPFDVIPSRDSAQKEKTPVTLFVTGPRKPDELFLDLQRHLLALNQSMMCGSNDRSYYQDIFCGIYPIRVDMRHYVSLDDYFARQGVDAMCLALDASSQQLFVNMRSVMAHVTRHLYVHTSIKDPAYREDVLDYYHEYGFSLFIPGLELERCDQTRIYREDDRHLPLQLCDFFTVSNELRACTNEQIQQWKRQEAYKGQEFFHLAYGSV